jgi:hypothetical protein
MARTVRIPALLLAGLALLTWLAFLAINRTTRGWCELDVGLRSGLVLKGARHALIASWRGGDSARVREVLSEITHDERIMAGTACNADRSLLAETSDYPGQSSCAELGAKLSRRAQLALSAEGRKLDIATEGTFESAVEHALARIPAPKLNVAREVLRVLADSLATVPESFPSDPKGIRTATWKRSDP